MDYIKIRFTNFFDQSTLHTEDVFRARPINPMFVSREHKWIPPADIFETDEEIFIRVEIAGVEKENLKVEINSKAIRISGQRSEVPMVHDATFRLAEIQYGDFERIFYLPAKVDIDIVSTSFANGFLNIRLVKLPRNITNKIIITSE